MKKRPFPELAVSPRGVTDPEKQFEQRIAHRYFVRFHMSMILAAVIASGVLSSKLLLELGVHSMRLRYPLATLSSYLVFLLLVRVWIWYVARNAMARSSSSGVNLGSGSVDLDDVEIGSGGEGGGISIPKPSFGGGSSGGGGASDSWVPSVNADVAGSGGPARSSGGGSRWFNFDFDFNFDDDGVILIVLGVLVIVILCAGGYLIYIAPSLLPEAAWQVAMASALTKVTQRIDHQNWVSSVLRASGIPFGVVVIMAGTLGWVAHHHCPHAVKLLDALGCAVQ